MKYRVVGWVAHVARRNMRNIYSVLFGKYEGTSQGGNPKNGCNVLKGTLFNDIDWIPLALDSGQCGK
jgi:hypothetical protein